jgi:halogenation protein CepH
MASKIQGDPEEALRALIAECPLISEYLKDAKRVTQGEYGELRVRKDYSYANTKFWRPGMALVGDAACFVDPVFSSGVHLATYGAMLGARSINSILAETVDEDTAFREFEQRYRREFGVYYEFLVAFYDLNVNEDSYFWSAKKVTDSTNPDLQSFVELVGGVSSGEAMLATAESSPEHYKRRSSEFAGAVDKLVANKEQNMVPIIKSSIVKSAMQEGAKEQARVMLGQDAGPETPVFDGGLIASPDGLSWSLPA